MQRYLTYCKKLISKENILYFTILFTLLALRTPADLFTPYLWAEDGTILIHGAIYDGIKSLAAPCSGTYWVIQRALGLLCYWMTTPFGSIAALPYIMQITAKILHVLTVMYFTSKRFEWFVAEKKYRFAICILIVLLMPRHASDTLTCETSLPFGLFFGAFLIGLDLLCSGRNEIPNTGQTIFLSLLALSTASAPCIGAVVCAAALQWIIFHFRTEKSEIGVWLTGALKIGIILAATAIQAKCILSSGRVSSDLDLLHRLLLNTKSFMFFPYWNLFHSWVAFFCGVFLWGVALYLTRLPWKAVAYSAGFSYLHMFYCSMTGEAAEMYSGAMVARYVFVCFEIAALMFGAAMVRLLEGQRRVGRHMAFAAAFGTAVLVLKTYNVPVFEPQIAQAYKIYSGVFQAEGADCVWIPIGPWRPWALGIPADISSQTVAADLEFEVEDLDQKPAGTEEFGILGNTDHWNVSGRVRTGTKDRMLKRLFIKKGQSYIAVTALTVQEQEQDEWSGYQEFVFHIDRVQNGSVMWLQEGMTTLELVGETDDGKWHSGVVEIQTMFAEE